MATFKEYAEYDALGLKRADRSPASDAARSPGGGPSSASRPSIPGSMPSCRRPMTRPAAVVGARLPPGPLAGVPYLMKDLYAWQQGVAHRKRQPALRRLRRRSRFHRMVQRYKAAGSRHARPPPTRRSSASTRPPSPVGILSARNPWNLECSAGGSSGGAAAAVAAGMVPAAARDRRRRIHPHPRRSLRLFGLKPTRGRNPAGPDVGEGWSGSCLRPRPDAHRTRQRRIPRCHERPAPGDPYWAPPPTRPFLEEVGTEPGQLRIGPRENGQSPRRRSIPNASRESKLPPACWRISVIALKKPAPGFDVVGLRWARASSSRPNLRNASTCASTP